MLPVLKTNRFNSMSNFIDDVEKHWNKVVDSFFAPSSIGDLKNKLKNNTGYPRIDAFTTKDSYCIQASVPGVKTDDLKLEMFIEDGTNYIRLSGQMSEEYSYKDDDTSWQMKELCRRAFTRTIALPDYLVGEPDANIKDGIVSLVWKLPKEVAQPTQKIKVIPIKK